jgi:hypothetical protein
MFQITAVGPIRVIMVDYVICKVMEDILVNVQVDIQALIVKME